MRAAYYIIESYLVYLALVGTWRIAKSTVPRPGLGGYYKNEQTEGDYRPWKDLMPWRIWEIGKWFFNWRRDRMGQHDLVILERQFNWGLRFLMLAIVLNYGITKVFVWLV